MMKRLTALLLCALLALVTALAEEPAAPSVEYAVPEVSVDLDVGEGEEELPADLSGTAPEEGLSGNSAAEQARYLDMPDYPIDNDALFAGYVDTLFGKHDALNLLSNGIVGEGLRGRAKVLYDNVVPVLKRVAFGSRASTAIYVPARLIPGFDFEKDWDAIVDFFNALLADYPYQLFWFDKVTGVNFNYSERRGLIMFFTVAQEYAVDTYRTDAGRIRAAHIAAKNARHVVRKHAGKSDYQKLCAYMRYICDAVDYNVEAFDDPDTPYGNPWQLIWVFDGDPATKVVCEGYSKAFQYLCDLSAFRGDVRAYTVTGGGGGKPDELGDHMWNIVTMENGRNYHVDITFCDSGLPGDFLVGAAVSPDGKYYSVMDGQAVYAFDEDAVRTFPRKRLRLSKRDYRAAE